MLKQVQHDEKAMQCACVQLTIVFKQRYVHSTNMHNRIALFRADRAVSRRELAEAVGVNAQTIGFLERGDYKPSLELAMKIALYFGVPVETVFSFTPFESVAATLARRGESLGISPSGTAPSSE